MSSQKDNKQKNNSEKTETKEEKVVFKEREKKETKEQEKTIKNKTNQSLETTKKTKEENKSVKSSQKTEKIEKNETEKNIKKEVTEVEKEANNKKIMTGVIILIVVLIIILIFSTIFAMLHSMTNKVAKGVKIKDIDISGLTYNEATQKLDKEFQNALDLTIDLSYKEEYSYKIKPEDINYKCDYKDELDKAYSIGRNGNIVECNYYLLWTMIAKKNINVNYSFDKDVINSIVEEIATSVPGIVTSYSYYIEENNLIINPGTDGIKIDKEKLKEIIINTLENRKPSDNKNLKNLKFEIPYEEAKAEAIDIDKIYSEVHSEPKDASYTPATETEKAKIIADIDGIDFAISIDEAKAKLEEVANEYIIPINRTKANVTINDIGLEAFPSKIQEFSTRYDASNYGRSENLRVATSKINGTVLMPGEQFSFNKVVGERTVQEGYKNAAIYSGDGVVEGLAGGICQVSSTLYNVALLSNLQIDERYNHSFVTTYVGAGKDATVVYGVKDFKFTNTRSYPIKIKGYAENGVIGFEIYGIEEDVEYKINIVTEILETHPYTTQTVQDNSLQPGTQYVSQVGASGYKSVTYKEKVLNGAIVSKEVLSNDIYKPMTRIIHVGPSIQ